MDDIVVSGGKGEFNIRPKYPGYIRKTKDYIYEKWKYSLKSTKKLFEICIWKKKKLQYWYVLCINKYKHSDDSVYVIMQYCQFWNWRKLRQI